ncbi:hypothetical protein [Algoriphagus aquimarinus]|uniref:Uncharacterized protein n=1 Tax=Algoriphagus aquimarinus TaxID=237018 RepID=A0A1I1B1W6_9BACT|nr:hypothetical protein [Algoriphagus aquimarinus]SFB43782.1 hypothetical protein SAMN04489723_11077 [Algoriphagus aquimarinus]
MNIRALIFVFLLLTTTTTTICSSQTLVDYADNLKDCMSKEDISLLNEAAQTFETELKNKYKGKNLGQSYKSFLQDIKMMNIPPSFFLSKDSKEILARIKKSKTFDEIWVPLSSVESYDDIEIITIDEPQTKSDDEFEPYSTNPEGKYLNCLIKQNKNNIINEYLEAIKAVPGLSPGLVAGMLEENLTDKDLENSLTRLIIAINLYYEMVLMFDEK